MSDLVVKEDNADKIVKEIATAKERALEKIGLKAEGDVVGYMTHENIVDTGRLRNSITHRVMNDEDCVYVGTNVEYAMYVHEGTSKMKGRPYLTTPVSANLKAYRDIAEGEMKTS